MLNIPVSGMGSRAGFETRRVPTFRRYGRQFGSSKEVQVIPIDPPAILEFLDYSRGIERIPRLPKLQHDRAADARLIQRPCGEHAEIVNVARLVALITGADFSGKDFGQSEAR